VSNLEVIPSGWVGYFAGLFGSGGLEALGGKVEQAIAISGSILEQASVALCARLKVLVGLQLRFGAVESGVFSGS